MKRLPHPNEDLHASPIRLVSRLAGVCLVLLSLGVCSHPVMAASVSTVGGGRVVEGGPDAGFVDGNTFSVAQFNLPSGLAVSPTGNTLFVADSANSAIRKLDLAANLTSTLLGTAQLGGNTPVDVAVDGATNLYVLTSTDGFVRKYDANGNFLGIVNVTSLTAGAVAPTALALNGSTNILVTRTDGSVVRVNHPTNTTSTTLLAAGTFSAPGGIEVLDNGTIIVSDTGNHAIRTINPSTLVVGTLSGTVGTPGTNNGPGSIALFRTPGHVAKAGNNILVVADTGNHQVRLVDSIGNASLLYGVDSNVWFNLPAQDFPGWLDGVAGANPGNAETRLPRGVVVDGSGSVYVSEQFYHIIRKVSSTGLSGPGGTSSGDGTNVVINPPSLSISPNSGYFPSGTAITVTSSSSQVYYTTDGSTPTTNSPSVTMAGGTGVITWFNSSSDLKALQVLAISTSGTNTASTNVMGIASPANVVGIPTAYTAGIGATVYVPVVANIRTNDQLRSVGFRVEVVPDTGAPIAVTSINVISTSTNDFVPIKGASSDGSPLSLQVTPYTVGTTKGVAVSSFSPNNFLVTDFGVLALLEIVVPGTLAQGNTYTLRVSNVSGTSDGIQATIPIAAGSDRTLSVTNISYIVGDTSPGRWYNAGTFGNGDLDNSDANNVFLAALGLRVPFASSDAFNAMDVSPELPGSIVMGDGLITLNDYLTVNDRSLRLPGNTVNFSRAWAGTEQGINGRTNGNATLPARMAANVATSPGEVWRRDGSLMVASIGNVAPGALVDLPIGLRVPADSSLDGVAFRVTVEGVDGAPSVVQQVQLDPPHNIASIPPGLIPINQGVYSRLFRYGPGSNYLAKVVFRVPATASAGHRYRVRFESISGTIGDVGSRLEAGLETVRAEVRVLESVTAPPALVSEQWVERFFTGLPASSADLFADPDGDGVPNWKEFLAGTDPTKAGSRLELGPPESRITGQVRETVLRLLSAPGKVYVLEGTDDLASGSWTVLATFTGDGNPKELVQAANSSRAAFYRVRVLP